ncbi:MAG: efflux RND transporter periplasmic adaptor subunit [Chitinophagaceae bacterium]
MNAEKIYLPLLLAFVMLASCGEHTVVVEKNDNPVPDSVIAHAETATVAIEDIAESVKLNGKVIPNESKQAKVYALVSGKIKSLSVELGDEVKKGQTLAVLQSTEVAGVANDMSLAQSNVDIAKKNLESTEDLYKSNLATERDLTSAKLEFNKASSELNRAKQVSAITGGTNATFVLTAPISGTVIEKTITNNSEVRQDNSNSLFTVADLSNVWVIANVYESDINKIKLGDNVVVNTLSAPEKNYIGKIDKVYDVLDPASRTMKVRISMNNAHNELKPEMFATINVKGKSEGRMLAIPSKAVVMDNSKQYVVVKKDKQLSIKPIQVQKRIGDLSFITGLTQGELVVTNSQVFLYEALNSK